MAILTIQKYKPNKYDYETAGSYILHFGGRSMKWETCGEMSEIRKRSQCISVTTKMGSILTEHFHSSETSWLCALSLPRELEAITEMHTIPGVRTDSDDKLQMMSEISIYKRLAWSGYARMSSDRKMWRALSFESDTCAVQPFFFLVFTCLLGNHYLASQISVHMLFLGNAQYQTHVVSKS